MSGKQLVFLFISSTWITTTSLNRNLILFYRASFRVMTVFSLTFRRNSGGGGRIMMAGSQFLLSQSLRTEFKVSSSTNGKAGTEEFRDASSRWCEWCLRAVALQPYEDVTTLCCQKGWILRTASCSPFSSNLISNTKAVDFHPVLYYKCPPHMLAASFNWRRGRISPQFPSLSKVTKRYKKNKKKSPDGHRLLPTPYGFTAIFSRPGFMICIKLNSRRDGVSFFMLSRDWMGRSFWCPAESAPHIGFQFHQPSRY